MIEINKIIEGIKIIYWNFALRYTDIHYSQYITL